MPLCRNHLFGNFCWFLVLIAISSILQYYTYAKTRKARALFTLSYRYSESIEWFLEGQAFSCPYYVAPNPSPSLAPISKLDWRHTGRLRKSDNLLTGDGGTARKLGLVSCTWFKTLVRYYTLNDWLLCMRIFLSFLSDKEVQASQETKRVESNEDTFANIIIEVLRYARRHYQHHPWRLTDHKCFIWYLAINLIDWHNSWILIKATAQLNMFFSTISKN